MEDKLDDDVENLVQNHGLREVLDALARLCERTHADKKRLRYNVLNRSYDRVGGEDLLTEYALYEYLAAKLGYPAIPHHYLPRMKTWHGHELDNVSKTVGDHKIRAYREMGMTPEEVIQIVKRSCLKDAKGEFSLDNIQPRPMLVDTVTEHHEPSVIAPQGYWV